MMFSRLDIDQVNSTHQLFIILRQLRLIGLMKTTTEQIRITDSGKPMRYCLTLDGYDATMKGKFTSEELIERYFAASIHLQEQIDACTRQTE